MIMETNLTVVANQTIARTAYSVIEPAEDDNIITTITILQNKSSNTNLSFNNDDEIVSGVQQGAVFTSSQIVYMLFGVIGVITNGLSVLVLLKSKKMRENLTNHFLVNQSIIDLVASMGLLATIPIISRQHEDFFGTTGYIRCIFLHPLVLVWAPFLTSSYNIVAMAIEKWYQISRPLEHKKNFTARKAYIMMAVAWIVGFMYVFCLSIAMQTVVDGNCTQYGVWRNKTVKKVRGAFTFTVKYLAPIVILVYCYGSMIKSLNGKAAVIVASDKRNQKMRKAQRNIFKTLLGVVICFILCVSYNQFLFLGYNLGLYQIDFTSFMYHLSVSLYYLNCFVYPFVYLFKYPEFKATLYGLFKRNRVSPA